jgi:hypothetical protein
MNLNANVQGMLAGITTCTLAWTLMFSVFTFQRDVVIAHYVLFIVGFLLVAIFGAIEIAQTQGRKWYHSALYASVVCNLIGSIACAFSLDPLEPKKPLVTFFYVFSFLAGVIGIYLFNLCDFFKRKSTGTLLTDVAVSSGMALWILGFLIILICLNQQGKELGGALVWLALAQTLPAVGFIISVWIGIRALANQQPETSALSASKASPYPATGGYGAVDTMNNDEV